jgi:ADP-ribose pyrophosphatase YjhB (NUDIX family)
MMEANSPQEVFRFCPKCGSGGLCTKENNLLSCGACGLEYFINPVMAVSAIIVDRGGRLLLVRRARDPMRGKLDLPGGFVDLEESAEDALIREIKEELDIVIEGHEYFMSHPNKYQFGGITYFTIELAFICRISEHGDIALSDEIEDYVLARPGDIKSEDIAFPSTRAMLERYGSIYGG